MKYEVTYFNDLQLDINFRENFTFKFAYTTMFDTEVGYGKYKQIDSTIILLDRIKWGGTYLKDTLYLSNDGLDFTLNESWRIKEGTLRFRTEYDPSI